MIIKDNINNLWELTKEKSGITKEYYYSYFKGKLNVGCLELKNIKFFDKPLELHNLGINYPLQNYMYL